MWPEYSQEPDIIGSVGPERPRPGWRRYAVAAGVLALAGIIAATSLASSHRPAAASRPSGVPAGPSPAPVWSLPPQPVAVPTQAWVVSLGIANWPMPGSGTYRYGNGSMFAGGIAGRAGWILTLQDVARPGQRCSAAVAVYNGGPRPIATYPVTARPALRTPAGDLAFLALGAKAPGVGVGFLQLAGPAALATLDPGSVGGLEISTPVVGIPACGTRYYLAGFAYPLAGTLDISVSVNVHYLVPARLSRPRAPGVWESTG